MLNYVKFILVGLIFSQLLEFFTHEVVGADGGGYGWLMIPMYFVILTIYYLGGKFIKSDVTYILVFSVLSIVVVEWILIGLTPQLTGDPGTVIANLLFQIGMLAYWGSVAYLPRLSLDSAAKDLHKKMLKLYIPWVVLLYIVGIAFPWEGGATILPIFAYEILFVILFYWQIKYALSK